MRVQVRRSCTHFTSTPAPTAYAIHMLFKIKNSFKNRMQWSLRDDTESSGGILFFCTQAFSHSDSAALNLTSDGAEAYRGLRESKDEGTCGQCGEEEKSRLPTKWPKSTSRATRFCVI